MHRISPQLNIHLSVLWWFDPFTAPTFSGRCVHDFLMCVNMNKTDFFTPDKRL